VIIDSDVIIEVLRGNRRTAGWLRSRATGGTGLRYSPVSRAEIRAGARASDLPSITGFFATLAATPIQGSTADIAGEQLARFGRSHGVQMGDALIAAAAIELSDELATFNAKHFPGVAKIVKPKR
jgi:predicted nucleic acid-binding protein